VPVGAKWSSEIVFRVKFQNLVGRAGPEVSPATADAIPTNAMMVSPARSKFAPFFYAASGNITSTNENYKLNL
jgi:hypothetical protein